MLTLRRFSLLGAAVFALAAFDLQLPPPPPMPTPTPVPTPGPTIQPLVSSPGRSNIYSLDQMNAACEGIIPFDGKVAYKNAPKDQPILWGLGVNFELLSPAGDPVACFKLYRSDMIGEYHLLYTFLIDTCDVSNIKQVTFTVPGQASFRGNGHIACEVNLAQWMAIVASSETDPAILFLLQNFYLAPPATPGGPPQFQTFHTYENFTMVGRGTTPSSDPDVDWMPIVKYKPLNPSTLTAPVLGLTVAAGDLYLKNCYLSYSHDYFWWYDLRTDNYNQFTYSEIIPATAYPDCGRGSDLSPLAVSIGQAVLYIGYDDSTTYKGALDGVLIDPTDSKPPQEGGSI
jgi:hypothetical protein